MSNQFSSPYMLLNNDMNYIRNTVLYNPFALNNPVLPKNNIIEKFTGALVPICSSKPRLVSGFGTRHLVDLQPSNCIPLNNNIKEKFTGALVPICSSKPRLVSGFGTRNLVDLQPSNCIPLKKNMK